MSLNVIMRCANYINFTYIVDFLLIILILKCGDIFCRIICLKLFKRYYLHTYLIMK